MQLLKSELLWTLLFFRNQAQLWFARSLQAEEDGNGAGYVAYALRQEYIWKQLERRAEKAGRNIV